MQKYIIKQFKIRIGYKHIYYILKTNNITFKKAQKNAYLYDTTKFTESKERLKKEMQEVNHKINYSDETSLSLCTKPDYGWSPKGKDCIIKQKKYMVREDTLDFHV